MSNTLRLDKRINEEVASIRKTLDSIPDLRPGVKRAINNRLSALTMWGRKGMARLERGIARHSAYDARTADDIAEQEKKKKGVFLALLSGATLDMTCSDIFEVGEFHTVIHKIRREISQRHPDLQLCDEWCRPGNGRRPYKRYWITKIVTSNS